MTTIVQSAIAPAEFATAPAAVRLSQTENGWVTHLVNCEGDTQACFHGHYYEPKQILEATKDYDARCKKLGVCPVAE